MRLLDWIFALAAVAGAAVFLIFYDSAFPAAGIELDLTRDQIEARADEYIREQGIDPDAFKSTLTFEVDGGAAVFLQRVRGLEATSRFARERLALWNWRARWFRSGEKEEYVVRLDPEGEVLRYRHLIPEAAEGDSISQDSARALAAAFVTSELGIDLADWRLEDQSTEALDNRLDHSFTWEMEGSEIEWRPEDPEAGTASVRLSVQVQGSEIGGFSRYLDVPERFQRELSSETSVGNLLGLVSLALMFALVVIALVLAIVLYKRDRIRWGGGLWLGSIVAVTAFLTGLLSYPLLKAQYLTNVPYGVFVGVAAVGLLVVSVAYGLAIWVSAASGETLTRESFPSALRAFSSWIAGRFFTRGATAETLRGYAVGLAFIGYVTLFYIVGTRHLGVWLPADSPHSQLLGMYLPWLVPLLIATQAAVSEETIFRLFGVSLVKRYLKSTFVALLIPAVIWAFAHSTYPVYPVYVRGIELTIAGFVFGWVFIRYGLLTMLIAHFVIDAVLLAMPFLRSEGGSYIAYGVAALVFAALPLLVVVLGWRREEDGGGLAAAG